MTFRWQCFALAMLVVTVSGWSANAAEDPCAAVHALASAATTAVYVAESNLKDAEDRMIFTDAQKEAAAKYQQTVIKPLKVILDHASQDKEEALTKYLDCDGSARLAAREALDAAARAALQNLGVDGQDLKNVGVTDPELNQAAGVKAGPQPSVGTGTVTTSVVPAPEPEPIAPSVTPTLGPPTAAPVLIPVPSFNVPGSGFTILPPVAGFTILPPDSPTKVKTPTAAEPTKGQTSSTGCPPANNRAFYNCGSNGTLIRQQPGSQPPSSAARTLTPSSATPAAQQATVVTTSAPSTLAKTVTSPNGQGTLIRPTSSGLQHAPNQVVNHDPTGSAASQSTGTATLAPVHPTGPVGVLPSAAHTLSTTHTPTASPNTFSTTSTKQHTASLPTSTRTSHTRTTRRTQTNVHAVRQVNRTAVVQRRPMTSSRGHHR